MILGRAALSSPGVAETTHGFPGERARLRRRTDRPPHFAGTRTFRTYATILPDFMGRFCSVCNRPRFRGGFTEKRCMNFRRLFIIFACGKHGPLSDATGLFCARGKNRENNCTPQKRTLILCGGPRGNRAKADFIQGEF